MSNLFSGERGLFSYFKKKEILYDLKKNEETLMNKIVELEFKNTLLNEDFSLDYIETLIRERFLFGKNNETIYIIRNNEN